MRREFHGLTDLRGAAERIQALLRFANRRRPRGSAPAMADPPRGPLPMQGGAAAPLDFD